MELIVIFIPTLLLGVLGNIKESGIPDPLIAALSGVAILTLSAVIIRVNRKT